MGDNTTINALTEAIIKITGKDLGPIYEEPRAGGIRDSMGIPKAIGYKPRYGLEEGLKETIRGSSGAN